jgi:hypothetical protein
MRDWEGSHTVPLSWMLRRIRDVMNRMFAAPCEVYRLELCPMQTQNGSSTAHWHPYVLMPSSIFHPEYPT